MNDVSNVFGADQSASVKLSAPMPPRKRRKILHKQFASFPVSLPAISPSTSFAQGIRDLAQNGGLQLFIDALTIYRRYEQQRIEINSTTALAPNFSCVSLSHIALNSALTLNPVSESSIAFPTTQFKCASSESSSSAPYNYQHSTPH